MAKNLEIREQTKKSYNDIISLDQALQKGQRDRYQYRSPKVPIVSFQGKSMCYNGFNIHLMNKTSDYQRDQIVFLYYISLRVPTDPKKYSGSFEDMDKIEGLPRLEQVLQQNPEIYLVILFDYALPEVVKKVMLDTPILSAFNVGISIGPEQRCSQTNSCEVFEPDGTITYFGDDQFDELNEFLLHVHRKVNTVDSDNEMNCEFEVKDGPFQPVD